MESDIEAMYEVGWDSKEVLWARYLGILPARRITSLTIRITSVIIILIRILQPGG